MTRDEFIDFFARHSERYPGIAGLSKEFYASVKSLNSMQAETASVAMMSEKAPFPNDNLAQLLAVHRRLTAPPPAAPVGNARGADEVYKRAVGDDCTVENTKSLLAELKAKGLYGPSAERRFRERRDAERKAREEDRARLTQEPVGPVTN